MTPFQTGHNENIRQLEHLAPIVFAFLLRYLTWTQALLCAGAAIFYALFISPRVFRLTQRPEEQARGYSPGKLAYGVCIFFLILLFPEREFIVVATWANLSVGDAASNVFGRRFGRARLPWNPAKSWVGLLSAFVLSSVTSFVLLVWTGIPGELQDLYRTALLYSISISIVCSFLETVRLPIDDNITICIGGSAFLLFLSEAGIPPLFPTSRWVLGAIVSMFIGFISYALRTVTVGGFISGIVIGSTVFGVMGIPGFLLLGTFFVLGSFFSRVGYSQKSREGIAQEHSGRRSSTQVWGKGFAAFAAALSVLFLTDKRLPELAYVAGVACSLADTTATELGKVYGRGARLLATFHEVPRGTPGAVTVAGSMAGTLAAGLMAALAHSLGLVSPWGATWVVVSATLATHLESYLGGRGDSSGALLNAFHTTIASLLAVLLGRIRL